MKIIVDAFGGDNAPLEIIKGSRSAKNDFGVDIALVGDKEKIFSCAAQNKISLNDIDIIDAPDVIAMTDQPGEILKSKKKVPGSRTSGSCGRQGRRVRQRGLDRRFGHGRNIYRQAHKGR